MSANRALAFAALRKAASDRARAGRELLAAHARLKRATKGGFDRALSDVRVAENRWIEMIGAEFAALASIDEVADKADVIEPAVDAALDLGMEALHA